MKKYIIIFQLLFSTSLLAQQIDIINPEKEIGLNNWRIVNDNVMGGISKGSFKVEDDRVIFYGKLSSQFNGGFASIRNRERIHLENNEKITLKVIGDGNIYQIRIKDSYHNFHSYYHEFSTLGQEELITLSFSDFKPIFRGSNLLLDNLCFKDNFFPFIRKVNGVFLVIL